MNEKFKEFLINNDLPLPGTILYPPMDKIIGRKLLRYEINSNGMFAIMEGIDGLWKMTWTLEQVKLCTFETHKRYNTNTNMED